jgi:hypothetical protein
MSGQMPTVLNAVVWLLSVICALFIGGFLKSYMLKKGENLATHEDIEKLVDQVRAVTTATKEIEAKISGEVWDRQKRWELKRDVLLQAARRMADIQKAMIRLETLLKVETDYAKKGESSDLSQQRTEALSEWRSATSAADETALLLGVVCGKQAAELFNSLNSIGEAVVKKILEKDTSAYRESVAEISRRAGLVRDLIRSELGTDLDRKA